MRKRELDDMVMDQGRFTTEELEHLHTGCIHPRFLKCNDHFSDLIKACQCLSDVNAFQRVAKAGGSGSCSMSVLLSSQPF